MKNFDEIYDNMSGIFSKIENIMGYIYQDLQLDPNNEKNCELLQQLGEAALKVLDTQRELVETNAFGEISGSLISNIDSKALALTTALSQTNQKKR